MHANTFFHKLLRNTTHKSRIKLLSCVVMATIQTKELKLTSLGRALDLPIQERSGIRKIDRLLGNVYFQERSDECYGAMIAITVGAKRRPIVIVDWTKLPNVNEYALRAAIAMEGRAITLYEEVHPKKKEGNSKVHQRFIMRLKKLLPLDCNPIVVTDAGFRNPWFKEILKQGWDYIGRVRGLTKYYDGKVYKPCVKLHRQATLTPQFLGEKALSKEGSLVTNFYCVRQKLKGRKKYTRSGKRSINKDSKNYSRSYREPWLLVSSLKGYRAAKKVITIYKQRMTIEEGFRDMKSSQYGFSMENNKTQKRKRLTVWLLIAALASLLAWIVGYRAEQLKLHYQFQSNTIRHRRVLSFFYLGCQVIRKKIPIPIDLRFLNTLGEEVYV
jgi:DDE family transposase